MQTQIIKFSRKKFVAGLKWYPLDPNDDQREQINYLAIEQDSHAGVVLTLEQGRSIGFVRKNGKRHNVNGLPTLVNLIAKNPPKEANDRYVVLIKIDDNDYWFGDIYDKKAIKPGTDIIIERSEAQNRIEACKRKNIQVFTDDAELGEGVTILPTEDLVSLKIDRKNDLVRPLSGKSRYAWLYKFMVIAIIGAIFMVFAIIKYQENLKNQKSIEAKRLQAELQNSETVKGQEYQIGKALAEITETPSITNTLNNYLDAIEKIKIDQKGWQLDEIECKNGSCTGKRGQQAGTNKELKTVEENAQFDYSGRVAFITILLEKIGNRQRIKVNELPTEQAFLTNMGSIFQNLGKKDIQNTLEKPYKFMLPGRSEKDLKVSTFQQGHWTLRGKELSLISEVAQKLDNQTNMCVTMMNIRFNFNINNTEWRIEGRYALQ